jgi:Ca2+-binding RTX toxin-like protein
MYGDAGDDQIDGHFGDDIAYGDGITPAITDGNDWITGGDGKDYIVANGGNDTIEAGNGDNKVFAGTGDDSVVTGSGQDIIYGEAGIDTIVSGGGDDFVDPGPGAGVVDTGSGDDLLAVTLNANFTLTNAALFLDSDQVVLTSVERLAMTGTGGGEPLRCHRLDRRTGRDRWRGRDRHRCGCE